jgi:putative oxidoreductase
MSLGLLILRLVVGLLFMGHGAQKLLGILGSAGPDGNGSQFDSVGLRPGKRNALIAGLGEFVGGLLVLLGWFMPLGAAAIIAVMLAAIWTVHARNGLWVSDGGFEYHLVVIAVLSPWRVSGPAAGHSTSVGAL